MESLTRIDVSPACEFINWQNYTSSIMCHSPFINQHQILAIIAFEYREKNITISRPLKPSHTLTKLQLTIWKS
jgi:hypothetical protein